jgi:hypothetical protein
VEELEKQAQLSMGVLITAAFVLLGFTMSLEELVKPGVTPEPIALFGVKLPTMYAPLLLLLVMAASLVYLASTCSAMTRCLRSGAPRGKAGSWVFFHPGREAVVLGLTWVCAAPVLDLVVLTRSITLLGWERFQTARDMGGAILLELALFLGLVVVASWASMRALAARAMFLSEASSGSPA